MPPDRADRADPRSDRELLDAIADDGRGALEELYARHAPWLTLRLARRCPEAELVDQAVQDTFVAVWRKPNSYKGQGEVAAWIWGIGIRRLIDQLRRQPKLQWSSSTEEALHVSAEDEVLVGVEHGDLPAAINQLSPELRLVVQATVLDGLTTREASRLLGIPTGTVKTRMARARVQLREALV
ncbi:MAG TPA: RNA polymerase sigma factor [Acidimicrobiales bacterium]|nr:RNA polymerase sigma factor [Acidimicrobiales bacterium]